MRRRAARACQNNLKQLGLACINYEAANKRYPPASSRLGSHPSLRADWGWLAVTLPFYEQGALYSLINKEANWFDEPNRKVTTTPLTIIRCPSRGELEPVNFLGPGNNPNEGFGKEGDSAMRSHYCAIFGANTKADTGIPYYCNGKVGVYTMELDDASEFNANPPCLSINVTCGPVANNGIIIRKQKIATKDVTDP